mmetsp:Transcript_72739/g.165059  ORF Transcript_72739/g.165059 Transcript_72739/m.165059 type:complete len:214 (+) Transcript_72739:80-721(+)
MGHASAPGPARRQGPLLAGLLLALVGAASGAKAPAVKWGQKPERLYVTIPLAEVSEPEVTIEEKRIYFKGVSRGVEYEANLKLLRGINVTESKHDINKWSIQFDLKKVRKEPCWKRLLRSKTHHSWLKKDHDRTYSEACQVAKEAWREAYFTAKLQGKDPSSSGPKAAEAPPDLDRERKVEEFQKVLRDFRAKAVPRKPAPRRRGKKLDQDEL